MRFLHHSLGLLLGCGLWAWGGAPLAAQSVEGHKVTRSTPETPPADVSAKPNLQQAAEQIVAATNVFRQEQGLKPVASNAKLTAAAQYFADFMARTGKYGHTADGQRPAQRATAHEYDYCLVLENIAYRYSSADFTTADLSAKFITGWQGSEGHRANLLDPDVTETGVALAAAADKNQYYAVQMFGRPKSQQLRFQVRNRTDAEIAYRISEPRGAEPETFTLPPRYIHTHERCRPPQVTFHLKSGDETIAPATESQFVLQPGPNGQTQIIKQPAS